MTNTQKMMGPFAGIGITGIIFGALFCIGLEYALAIIGCALIGLACALTDSWQRKTGKK
jgi:hypothetical protein